MKSITINIFYKGENVLLFMEEMINSGIVDLIKKEVGNLKYDYYIPYNDDKTILLIDSWESQEALDKHHSSKMMKEIIRLREKYNISMELYKYIKIDNTKNDELYIRK